MLKRLTEELQSKSSTGELRSLVDYDGLVDFASNDYLGLNQSGRMGVFSEQVLNETLGSSISAVGSGGSRLLTGNSEFHISAEKEFASYFQSESALIFSSGYSANLGLLSAVLKRSSTVIFDEYSHASIKDGIRLGFAKSVKFKHNDCLDLESKLSQTSGDVFVVIESLYSMDGDFAPLQEIAKLCENWNAQLIVDEAHASGVYGPNGEGLCVASSIDDKVFARIHTFGKALGSHGAIVAGSDALRNYLINFSRPFIYTTALPASNVAAMLAGVKLASTASKERADLQELITYFRNKSSEFGLDVIASDSQIQGIIFPGVQNVIELSQSLHSVGLDVRAIKSPTVREGTERLRISLHAFNTILEIDKLLNRINDHINE